MGDFWKIDSINEMNMIDNSRVMGEDDPMRLSYSLGTSMLLQRKYTSNPYNKMSF